MDVKKINDAYETHGKEAWSRCIPTIRGVIEELPMDPDKMSNTEIATLVTSISLIAAKSFRLGFKIGVGVGDHENSQPKIINTLN